MRIKPLPGLAWARPRTPATFGFALCARPHADMPSQSGRAAGSQSPSSPREVRDRAGIRDLCWSLTEPPSRQPAGGSWPASAGGCRGHRPHSLRPRSRLRRDLGRPRPGSPRGSGVHSYLVPDPIAFAHQPGPLHRMPGLQRRRREVAAVGSGPLLGPGVPRDGRWGTGKKANPTLLGGAYVWVPSCSLGMKSRDPNLLPSNICGPVFSSIPLLWAGDTHPPVPEASALMPPPSPCS